MGETWRDVPGYEGLYQVSDQGRVKNARSGHIRKPREKWDGYLQVNLSRNNRAQSMAVHRLVALAFLPNPESKPQINHINGKKTDNRAENLEWCTGSENQRHRFDVLKKRAGNKKPIVCTDTGRIYPSAKAAAEELGVQRSAISCCCNGSRSHTKNYHFKFLEE